jgi:hypothetical protein
MCAAAGAFIRRRRGAPEEVMRLARAAEFQGERRSAMTEPGAWHRYSVWLWPAEWPSVEIARARSTVGVVSVLIPARSGG